MPIPNFSPNEILTADVMDKIGLWRIKKYDLTGLTINTFDITDVFSADFENYKILFSGATSGSTGNFMTMQLLGLTTGVYAWAHTTVTYAGALTAVGGGANSSSWRVGTTSTSNAWVNIDVLNPFTNGIRPSFTGSAPSGSTATAVYDFAGTANTTLSFTGVRLFTSNGSNWTGGRIYVYGYNSL